MTIHELRPPGDGGGASTPPPAECEPRDLGTAFMRLEPDIRDIDRMAKIANMLAMDVAQHTIHPEPSTQAQIELLMFSVEKLREMVEALQSRYYELWDGAKAVPSDSQ